MPLGIYRRGTLAKQGGLVQREGQNSKHCKG